MPIKRSALDLVDCEREPIHTPQSIQACAILLLFDSRSGTLALASENIGEVFGQIGSAADAVGRDVEAFFSSDSAQILRETMSDRVEAASQYLALADGREHFVRMFETGDLLGLEVDIAQDAALKEAGFGISVGEAMTEIAARASPLEATSGPEFEAFCDLVVRRFRDLSGYDRAMIYRFDTDWNGQVIAEAHSPDLSESYMGLWFPSSDIPRQARALFLRNRVRPVVDIHTPSVPLYPALHPRTGRPVDLSDCSIRAVSPVHVEYLRNMGVGATLNIALVVRNELWGLLTCHHYSAPYRLSPGQASACRLMCENVSSELGRIVERSHTASTEIVRDTLRGFRNLVLDVDINDGIGALLHAQAPTLLDILHCDGLVLVFKDQVVELGAVPEPQVVGLLRERIAEQYRAAGENFFSTHYASGLWPDLEDRLLPVAAGVLACRPDVKSCEILAFRKARETEMTWGGDPYKRVQPDAADQKLHPRNSFEKWSETVTNRARPWPRRAVTLAREMIAALGEIEWLFEWRRSEAKLAMARAETAHTARHDPLTELPNRRYLHEYVEGLSGRDRLPSALLHVDLDGFNDINESHGHATGDYVLKTVASRLTRYVRDVDFCARIGGDEFVIIATGGTTEDGVRAMGQRIVDLIAKPVHFGGNTCSMSASLGVAINDGSDLPTDELLHRADLALHQAKKEGRGRMEIYSPDLEEKRRLLKQWGEQILIGLSEGQFNPFYQPQFDATTRELVGVEALMRWNHPAHGILDPGKFLPQAEEMGIIGDMDRACMQAAMRDHAIWEAAGIRIPRISLNLSAKRLSDPDLLRSIEVAGASPGLLSFELLESIYLDEVDLPIEENLVALRDLGFPLEIDDFGTGRTSIVSLVQLRPDRLKIDRQLVLPVVEQDSARRLISAVVEIGTSLGIGITAEGVETEAHAAVLRDLGCTILQGYALARPMPVEKITEMMQPPVRVAN